jgi:serine/threonine-protein kinase
VATPSSDIYGLGVVAYQCLAGRRPFEGDNPLEIAIKHVRELPRPLPADIPPAVRAIVDRALAKDPGARWPAAAILAAVARQAAANLAASPAQTRVPGGSAQASAPPAGQVSAAPASPGGLPHPARVAPPPRPPVWTMPPAARAGMPYRPTAPVAAPVPPISPAGRGGHPRGAAPVPLAGGQPQRGYGSAAPPAPQGPERRRSLRRSLLVLLAIALGVLVLICSGVISYRLRQAGSSAAIGSHGSRAVTAPSHKWSEGDDSRNAPYRQVERAAHAGGLTR